MFRFGRNYSILLHSTPAAGRQTVSSPAGLCILGSTGSIGTQTLQIVDALPGRFVVTALCANSSADLLVSQALRYKPRYVAVADMDAFARVSAKLEGTGIEVLGGADSPAQVAALDDGSIVVAAIVGFAGLSAVLTALERGATVALANKETLVAAGALVKDLLAKKGGSLVPVDSEHSAIFQCLQGEDADAVKRIILTASGGPFLRRPIETFPEITVQETLKHPNWSMGDKITVDSATMMNKGLEVIEAHWLFEIAGGNIDVLIHPQSIVHSMVEFVDGSVKAQMGVPDMRVPIQYALTWPQRLRAPNPTIDWSATRQLDFVAPDENRFPCLEMAYRAMDAGGTAPAALNAANEAAVARFLSGHIRYVDIAEVIDYAVARSTYHSDPDLQTLRDVDAEARRSVMELPRKLQH